jgi:hypothetical protein
MAGTYYMLRKDGSGFYFISTDCKKKAQSYVFIYRYSRCVVFQNLKYLVTGAIYQNHKAHSITNRFRKPMCVLFYWMYVWSMQWCANEWMRVLIYMSRCCARFLWKFVAKYPSSLIYQPWENILNKNEALKRVYFNTLKIITYVILKLSINLCLTYNAFDQRMCIWWSEKLDINDTLINSLLLVITSILKRCFWTVV